MKKEVFFTPAFDKRNPVPSKNYGIHGVDIRFVLTGDKGAVQFLLFTNWQLPHVMEPEKYCLYEPMAADLGYHSPTPMYEGQSIISEKCEFLDGKPCYYDGSGLQADRIYKILLTEGGDGVWKELEEYYHSRFG